MGIMRHPLRLFDSIADRIAVVVGVLLICQFPAYMDHYVQRLGGHVAEAKRNVAGWQEIADKNMRGNMDILIERYLSSSEAEFVDTGIKCEADRERYDHLREALDAMTGAGAWSRPFVFLKTFDSVVAHDALKKYAPGIPLHLEGLVYALIGFFAAFVFYRGCRCLTVKTCRSCAARLKKRRSSSGTPEDNRDSAVDSPDDSFFKNQRSIKQNEGKRSDKGADNGGTSRAAPGANGGRQ